MIESSSDSSASLSPKSEALSMIVSPNNLLLPPTSVSDVLQRAELQPGTEIFIAKPARTAVAHSVGFIIDSGRKGTISPTVRPLGNNGSLKDFSLSGQHQYWGRTADEALAKVPAAQDQYHPFETRDAKLLAYPTTMDDAAVTRYAQQMAESIAFFALMDSKGSMQDLIFQGERIVHSNVYKMFYGELEILFQRTRTLMQAGRLMIEAGTDSQTLSAVLPALSVQVGKLTNEFVLEHKHELEMIHHISLDTDSRSTAQKLLEILSRRY